MKCSRVSVLAVLAGFLLLMGGCSSTTSNSSPGGAAPSITAQPVNATVTAGQAATFSVAATGASPLSYQWQKNSANISGAAAASYTTPATTSGDNGAKFDVVVSNGAGRMTSSTAMLTVSATGVTLQSIAVTPASPSIVTPNTQQFTATGTYSDNSTKNITSSVTWKSSNTALATIGATTGLATGVAVGTTQITATQGTVVSPNDSLTVTASTATLQSIAVTPASPSIGIGNTVQFTATGTYSDNSTKNIATSVTWATSNALFATIGATTGLATGVAVGTTEITAMLGSVVSPNDPLAVAVTSSNATDVVTHHYDAMRSGANTHELTLTPVNVNSTTFGKVAEFGVDGQIDGQILYLNQVAIPTAGNKNVLYFATENGSVYAVDADSITSTTATVLWKTRTLPTGDAPLTPGDAGCGYINPVGIMSTPVIDRARNAIYVVASSKDSSGNVFHRLHALNLATGAELFGGPTPITATFPKTGGGTVTFQANVQQERAALLESNGVIYTAWSGYFGDCGGYSGWVIAFSAGTLAQVGAIDLVPGSGQAGIWLGGGGPAADSSGNVYLSTGNASPGNTPGITNDYGDTFVKLGPSVPLTVADYFAPSNAISDDNLDEDFGSAAALLLPDNLMDSTGTLRDLAVVAGKDGTMYVVDRNNMGQYSAIANNVYQEFPSDGQENFSSPVYFNGRVYIGPSNLPLEAFSVSNAKLSSAPTSQSAFTFGSNGTVPSVSANVNTNGIVWALDYQSGTLFAYDATNLNTVLYTSAQAVGGRDSFSNVGGHFITPMVANGKVYIGTGNTVAVFGLL
jgi:Bacterial Ig-like domain (group 2)